MMTTHNSRILQVVTVLIAVATGAFAQVPVASLEKRDILPLQEDFNTRRERVRLLLLVSPGCGRCLDTSREVEKILQEIADDRVRVLVVWEPLLDTDDYAGAQNAAGLIPDRRAAHYWEPRQILGLGYGEQLPLPNGFSFAVDVVLLFEPGAAWTDAGLPSPGTWFHKLGDDERTFSPEKLRDEIRKRLGSKAVAPAKVEIEATAVVPE